MGSTDLCGAQGKRWSADCEQLSSAQPMDQEKSMAHAIDQKVITSSRRNDVCDSVRSYFFILYDENGKACAEIPHHNFAVGKVSVSENAHGA